MWVQMVSFQETLRRLAMIDESFVEDEAGLRLDLARTSALDPRTASSPPPPTWAPHSGTTTRPHSKNWTIPDRPAVIGT